MKEQVSPAVMAVVIVVVLALVGFFGYKMFAKSSGVSEPKPANVSTDYTQRMQQYNQQRSGRGMGGSPYGGR